MSIDLGEPLLTHFGASRSNGPRILILPALGTPARTYRRLCESLAEIGYAGAVLEWPGCGAHPLRVSRADDWGYRQLLEDQVLPAIEAVANVGPGDPGQVVLLGHSLGAHLALMARAHHVKNVAGIIAIAAGTPYYRVFQFPARQALLYLIGAVKISVFLLGFFPGNRLGFGGREPRTLIQEWAAFARTGQLRVEQRDVLHVDSGSSTMPVRALSLARDIYAPPAAAENLLACAGLPATLVECVQDPQVHGHFHWLRTPQASARVIEACLQNIISPKRLG